MTSDDPQTYYLLRAKGSSVGDGPYVGLAPEEADGLVSGHLQARRFATLDEAERYAGSISDTASTFEIEVRTTT